MSIIARKNRETRKYKSRNEFRYNNSPTANHHPHYIFGEKGNKYKSLPLTTTRPDNVPYYIMKKNPNPNDNNISYMPLITPHTAKKGYYGKVLEGWSFAKEDMKEVRKRIKRYKKSYNRKPFMWYELKKQRLRQKRNEPR